MTQPRPRTANPGDLARLKQQLGGGTAAPSRARGTRDALFEYAYLGHVRTADERRQNSGTQDYLDRLADLAEDEDWDGLDATFTGEMRILKNYVQRTFEHVHGQGQVRESADGSYSVFNTGLSTRRQQTIYGVFVRNSATGQQKWRFRDWHVESSRMVLDNFPELPDFAVYTTDPADYIYDWRRRLVVDFEHVVGDNLERFPPELQGNAYSAELHLKSAVELAEKRVRRNYKAAVPFWYVTQKQVQLLLPLSLRDKDSVDLALVVSRQGEYYRGHTVLTTAMAYSNARLLTRPDSDWLRPLSAADDASDEA